MIEKMHETIAKQRSQGDITVKPAGFYSNHPDLFAQGGKFGPGLPPGSMNHPGGPQGAMLGHPGMPPGMGGMPMGGMGGMGAMYGHPGMGGGMGVPMAAMLGGDGQVNPQVVMDHMRSISTIIKQELEQGGHDRDGTNFNDAATPPEGSPPPIHSRRSSVTGCADSCGVVRDATERDAVANNNEFVNATVQDRRSQGEWSRSVFSGKVELSGK